METLIEKAYIFSEVELQEKLGIREKIKTISLWLEGKEISYKIEVESNDG